MKRRVYTELIGGAFYSISGVDKEVYDLVCDELEKIGQKPPGLFKFKIWTKNAIIKRDSRELHRAIQKGFQVEVCFIFPEEPAVDSSSSALVNQELPKKRERPRMTGRGLSSVPRSTNKI